MAGVFVAGEVSKARNQERKELVLLRVVGRCLRAAPALDSRNETSIDENGV